MPVRATEALDAQWPSSGRPLLAGILVCALFTLLVSGLFALDRGYAQDELWLFSAVRSAPSFPRSLVLSGPPWHSQPQRLLLPAVFALAQRTSAPRDFLQITFVVTWFATALLAGLLAWQAFEHRPVAALAAAGLTASATCDTTLNRLHALPAYLSVLAFLAAFLALLRFRQRGGWGWLVAALASLSAGLLTYDAPLAAALMAPPLLAVLPGGSRQRPLAGLAAAWYASLVPYLALLARFLFGARTHAAEVLEPFSPLRHGLRTLRLFAWNFASWRWAAAFAPNGQDAAHGALPACACALASAGGAIVLLLALARFGRGRLAPLAAPHAWRASAFIVIALLSNASVSMLNDLYVPFRSQLVSRVYVSIALAAVLDAGLERLRRGRGPLLALLGLHVGLGLYAGLLSQDLELGAWRQRRRELASMLEAVPAVRPGVTVLVQIPPGAAPLGLAAPRVGTHWLSLLNPDVPALVWNENTGTFRCAPGADGFACVNAQREGRVEPLRLPFASTLLVTYQPETGRFRLEPRLPAGLTWAYRGPALPEAATLVRPDTPTRDARQLLERPERLARWFPARRDGTYLPLLATQDPLVSLLPLLTAPGGLELRSGRQQLALRGSGAALSGVLFSASQHRAALRCRLDGLERPGGRSELELRHSVRAQAELANELALEIDVALGRHEFELRLEPPAGQQGPITVSACSLAALPPTPR